MIFDMYGPFQLDRTGGCITSKQPTLWSSVRQECAAWGFEATELEKAIGCYAFGLKNGDSLVPWYVGMTIAQRGFRGEILQAHKLEHYNAVLEERRGVPVMFLMPLMTQEWRFSRDRSASKILIRWVEKMLFGVALSRNPECRNQRDTKFLREVKVRGVFNHAEVGRPGPSVAAARRMFGT